MHFIAVKDCTPERGVEVILWRSSKAANGQRTFSHIFESNLDDKQVRAYFKGAGATHWSLINPPFRAPRRSKYVRDLIAERDKLVERLGYPTLHLMPREERRLKEIEKELFEDGKIFAPSKSKEDQEASDFIRRAAKLLKEQGDHDCKFIQLEEFGLTITIKKTKVVVKYKNAEIRGELDETTHTSEDTSSVILKKR